MFVYQNGRLYVQDDNGLAGVDICSGKVTKIQGTQTSLDSNAKILTFVEVQSKFGIKTGDYKFPDRPMEVSYGEEINVENGRIEPSEETQEEKGEITPDVYNGVNYHDTTGNSEEPRRKRQYTRRNP